MCGCIQLYGVELVGRSRRQWDLLFTAYLFITFHVIIIIFSMKNIRLIF